MHAIYHPTESEIMQEARSLLKTAAAPVLTLSLAPLPETEATTARRARSLRSCHYYSLYEGRRHPRPQDSGAYIPAMATRVENDLNLTDGARRCARKLVEETYRKMRATRALPVTVSYLANALGKCRRTVQRYLRLLEKEGYIDVSIVASDRSRMCEGLVVRLLAPLFPRHHQHSWPETRGNPDATGESQNYRHLNHLKADARIFSCEGWARRCMEGVFRSLMKTNPLSDLPPVLTA